MSIAGPRPILVGESEVKHVAVGDDIVFSFESELARFARAGLAVQGDIVVIGDGFGADEALLEIGMDDAGGLRRLGAALDGPGARLFRSGRKEGDEMQQLVTGADHAIKRSEERR